MKKGIFLWIVAILVGCGSDDNAPPPIPEGAILVFPLENSECTTGQPVNETLSRVTFEWQPSANTDLYTLSVVNLNTNTPQTLTTVATSASLSIEKGAPFSWSVTSTNTDSDLTASSESWLFYNAGSQTTYAPFPAQIIAPKSGQTIIADALSQVTLEWSGADVENDIDVFEVYFSEQNPPLTLLGTLNNDESTMDVGVVSGTTYYWKVITKDAEGNTSDSGVYDFKVL
ncbi:hypothetical protein [Flagellimonas lutaonensis]|uniref:Fibronectin type-III domain-containing protein n=1 Tax=Flagellimonas lutaonensis TaxID=516051 RepID=A0A0D5YTX0_9FLAO|nr:hypothetical protein [Allomuricauda lutaonensis]AKA35308.1 hypothetical protein VC82_1695 [Allomuricauda lutaonensis]